MSPQKKVPADYRTLAKQRGFRWLGPEVPNTATKTVWQCREGHQWATCYATILQGSGCPLCASTARKTPTDYHALAEQRGFRWLGPQVSRTGVRTEWECEQGHRWKACYNSIQQGSGCPICANKARRTPADYQALAKQRGFRWLGPGVPNNKTKTTWQCSKRHRWQACYAHIRGGRGCPICSGVNPLTPADYHALAKKRGFHWLGPEVPNNQTLTTWECGSGHRWETTYGAIQRGHGCTICAGFLRKEPVDYLALAKERGFHWLGPQVPNIRTKTTWQCAQGHVWKAGYGSIQSGYGCPFCARIAPKTPADYHALAAARGFMWLGPEVPTSHTKTTWKCSRGHVWEARYNSIQRGTGCPTCVDIVNGAQVSQVQRELATMLGGTLNYRAGRHSIDVALCIDGTKIAIEYDSWYWHANQQARDAQREKSLVASGWHVLRVKANYSLPAREQLDRAISQLLAGTTRIEIVLDDWGKGPARPHSSEHVTTV